MPPQGWHRAMRRAVSHEPRAALRELRAGGRLPAGAYLLGGSAELAELPWPALVDLVEATVVEATS